MSFNQFFLTSYMSDFLNLIIVLCVYVIIHIINLFILYYSHIFNCNECNKYEI